MTTDSKQLLVEQWQTLHNSHEKYEHYALIIKLVAVSTTLAAFAFSITQYAVLLLLAILWLQEGIWKTYQSRTADAIIALENKLASNETEQPYLFYKAWQASRSGVVGLIGEYIGNSLKPTVIYPYVPLMLVCIIF